MVEFIVDMYVIGVYSVIDNYNLGQTEETKTYILYGL